LLDLLNHRITPVVPRYGSVGASGDLIPSAYIARALLGEGEVFYQGKNLPASDALQHANFSRSELTAKEGLALVNGTTVMTGIAALVIYDGGYLARLVLACASFAVEALNATDDPFSVYLRLLSVPDIEEVFRPVRYCFTAAAPMAIPIARQWRERLRRPIYEGYGLTETSPFASYNHDVYYRDGSVETPIETVEMKIVDPEGLELPVGEQGEIAIKGPNVMLGYFRRPNETAEVLRGGWFLTGDIGKRDDDGYFYIVDRAKDMINVSGFKVWPREVEEILLQHPSISEVGVIGIADPVSVEAVKAFAVLKQRESISEQDLIEYARNRMAVYKAPRFIEFIDALSRNPAGKVLKRELRARATNDAAPSVRVA
jgi:long-chain acyl-CoA synthetase